MNHPVHDRLLNQNRAAGPELLSPAGDMDALRAAVANGADAVYFGLSDFNARHRATNFTLEELPETMRYLHERGVRGYVAFNTLIFSDELPQAADYLAAIVRAGADAVIVQDLGLVRLIKRLSPGFAVHGSTQMTLTEPRGIEFVRELGVERVILARELSLREIGRIARDTPMPLEVFVHGALCVAYSGQCLTSEALGGRSANRGQCAQACRQPYELMVDGRPRDLGDKAYLLSPQDLAAHDLIGDLADLGVCSLKIEGRLKSAHYVAVTTQTYRAAIDAAREQRPFEITRQQELDLAQSFSRGFTHGFLGGIDHQKLVQGRFPKNRGVRIGTVADVTKRGVMIELDPQHAHALDLPLKPGDGVVFDEGHPEQDEQGGRAFSVEPREGGVEVTFGFGDVNLAAITRGSTLWKTDDPAMRRRLERTFSHDLTGRTTPLSVEVRGTIGGTLSMTASDETNRVTVEWDQPLQKANKHLLTRELVREQWGRLGNTPFVLGEVELIDESGKVDSLPVMVPKSVLNELRRRAVYLLLERRRSAVSKVETNLHALDELRARIRGPQQNSPRRHGDTEKTSNAVEDDTGASRNDNSINDFSVSPCLRGENYALTILTRSLDQLQGVLNWTATSQFHPAIVYCDFEDVRLFKDAVTLCRAANVPVGLATPRIVKPGEEGLLQQIANCKPDAVLVRNLAALSYFREHESSTQLIGDYSLNVANEITASLFLEQGLARLVPSYDLNLEQLQAMLARIDPGVFEVVMHQHIPMFHMEHCVFSHVLSDGSDHHTCGRPCDLHRVELRDHVGEAHPLVADVGCRNTVFNAHAQSAAPYVPRLREWGVQCFRVELLRETAEESKALLDTYARVLAGMERGPRVWNELRVLNQLGVTRGTLEFA